MTPGGWLCLIASLLLLWVYAGYPMAAAIAGRLRPFRLEPRPMDRPLVTIGIAVHDEATQLEDRISNILGQTGDFDLEVVVASDGSTDASDSILDQVGRTDARIRALSLHRGGQTAAQTEIFRVASGQIVVLSDAETRFAPGCVARLVEPFADPRIGCTTGHLEWVDIGRTQTSRNEGIYWRYEQLVRRLESRAGWLTAATGALLAVRRSSFRPVPAYASMDHLLPLYVRDDGLVVLAVPEAVATDRPIAGLRDQFRNRARTATRGIRANISMAWGLAPWRRPSAALAMWSHKLLRWATPWLLGAVFVGALVELAAGSVIYVVPIGTLVLGAVLTAFGWWTRRRRGRAPRVAGLALAVAVVNLAFASAWLNVMLGRKIEAWHGLEWQANSGGVSDHR